MQEFYELAMNWYMNWGQPLTGDKTGLVSGHLKYRLFHGRTYNPPEFCKSLTNLSYLVIILNL